MNDQAAPVRRLKLKNPASIAPVKAAPAAARKKEPVLRPAPKPPRGAGKPPAPAADGYTVTTTLQGRHYEWLAAIARLEGRTIPQMLERLVRIGYSQDHGKVRPTGATQVGSAAGGDGLSGAHPARGSE